MRGSNGFNGEELWCGQPAGEREHVGALSDFENFSHCRGGDALSSDCQFEAHGLAPFGVSSCASTCTWVVSLTDDSTIVVWGGVAGLFAYMLYQSALIGVIMTSAILLNLLLGALAGLLIPLAMQRMGRDPAIGSSVLLTAITDSGGFLIFLGMATIFLMH